MKYSASGLELIVDPDTGCWHSLVSGPSNANWLTPDEDRRCGLPFVAATAMDRGHAIPVLYEEDEGVLRGKSRRGGIQVTVEPHAYGLTSTVTLPDRRGPRSGWCLDLNHLDLPGDRLENQVMPVCIQTDEDLRWSVVIWQRGATEYLLTAFEGPFAGWTIRYSYAGHRMRGFDVLARADDVMVPVERFSTRRLPTTTRLKVHLSAVASVSEGMERACHLLGLQRVRPSSTCVVAGDSVVLDVGQGASSAAEPSHGGSDLLWRRPDGTTAAIGADQRTVPLEQLGVHAFTSTAPNGSRYTSTVLALGDWRELAERSFAFHREYFQTESGAFARCINGDSLKPEGWTFEGVHFGDPDSHQSCRTGEFGGFGAWSQMIHMKHFGPNDIMLASVRAYFDWITNKGREDDPRLNTLCHTPHTCGGREYGPYHLYKEINYVQHEAWLLEHFADAIDLGMTDLQDLFARFSRHFLSEHVDEDGVVWNQNGSDLATKHDYCSVDAPLLHMLRAGRKLVELGDPLGEEMLARVRKGVEYVHRRGFNFATEGESCTEDGSMACIAWTLAAAFNELDDPRPEWLSFAKTMIEFHSKLEMKGDDIRTDGSSIRFWETQFESDDYGPSINASHGWTLWSALARWEIFRATGDFEHLWQAWRHSANVSHRFHVREGLPCCFTPDIIPSPPQSDWAWNGKEDMKNEGRMTTALMGLGYPSSLSMSGMHLFITAPQMWYRTCGYDAASGRLINARLSGRDLVPNTAHACSCVALGATLPPDGLRITGLDPTREIFLATPADLSLDGAAALRREENGWFCAAPDGTLDLRRG